MFVCSHIPGIDNGAANTLSRNALRFFQRLILSAAAVSTTLKESLLQCLVCGTPMWTGLHYSKNLLNGAGRVHTQCRFTAICSAACLSYTGKPGGVVPHFAATLAGEGLLLNPTCLVFVTCTFEGFGDPFSTGCTMFYGV